MQNCHGLRASAGRERVCTTLLGLLQEGGDIAVGFGAFVVFKHLLSTLTFLACIKSHALALPSWSLLSLTPHYSVYRFAATENLC